MRRRSRIAVSAAMTSGLLGVAGVAVASVPHLTTGSTPDDASAVGHSAASQRQALEAAIAQMDQRARSLEVQLASARADLLTASARASEAAAVETASPPAPRALTASHVKPTRSANHASPKTHKHGAPVSGPSLSHTHTTTGASGSTGGGGDDDGGDDRGGGSDDGGGGGSDD